jgi:transposase
MKAYSLDLRERVIAMLTETGSQPQVAKHFKVSLATVENWWRRWRETDDLTPRPHAGGAAHALQPSGAAIREAVKRVFLRVPV